MAVAVDSSGVGSGVVAAVVAAGHCPGSDPPGRCSAGAGPCRAEEVTKNLFNKQKMHQNVVYRVQFTRDRLQYL